MNLIVDPKQIPEFNGLLLCCLLWQKKTLRCTVRGSFSDQARIHTMSSSPKASLSSATHASICFWFSLNQPEYTLSGACDAKTCSALHLHDLTAQFPAWPGHLLVHLRVAGAPICVLRVNVVFNFYVLQSNIVRAHRNAAVPPWWTWEAPCHLSSLHP